MNKAFWQGKNVLITGHTGFKGSWLSLWLQQMGANVTGFALAPSTSPSLFAEANVASGMKSILGDIRDFSAVQAAVLQAKAEIVIHMAAQPLVRYSYANPIETYATNVMGTVHLLEAIRQTSGIKAVVNVTSDKCYENQEWPWGYRENEPMGGHDPYSNSKGCSELVTRAYRDSYFGSHQQVALGSGRAGNVIGGGDWAGDRLIPDMIRAIEGKTEVIIRSPDSIRPWQHVLEPLSGYLTLAEHLYTQGQQYADGWNFGPHDHDAKPVGWIVEQLTKTWGDGAAYRIDSAAATLHEAHYLKLDCSKAHMQLGWQPRWSLSHALAKICEWHKGQLQGSDMHQITLQQIKEYENS